MKLTKEYDNTDIELTKADNVMHINEYEIAAVYTPVSVEQGFKLNEVGVTTKQELPSPPATVYKAADLSLETSRELCVFEL